MLVTMESGLRLYQERAGIYPAFLDELIRTGFLDKKPTDAWGNAFEFWSDGFQYRITSYGRDGAPGCEDENEDITVEGP